MKYLVRGGIKERGNLGRGRDLGRGRGREEGKKGGILNFNNPRGVDRFSTV